MADRMPTKTTSMINSLPEFTVDVYAKFSRAELVVFAVHTLQDNGHYAATEEIVSACFRLFAHRFSLKNYFYWPDSALVLLSLNEAKEKGDLKGKPADGFAVKVQGRQTVKRVAKALGVILPAPEKRIRKPSSAPAKEKVESAQPAKDEIVKKQAAAPEEKKSAAPVIKEIPAKVVALDEKKSAAPIKKEKLARKKLTASKEKKSAAPVVLEKTAKKTPAKRTKPVKQIPVKKAVTTKAKALPKPAPIKQEILPQIKVEPRKKEQAKLIARVSVKKTSAPKKEKARKPVHVKSAHPAQLIMSLPPVEEKKTKPAPPVVKKVQPKPVKVEMMISPTAVMHVSREEKVKAGKVVHLMERSDAYRQYKKNGEKSRISEFDFRSLLLCTMESSPETLARNIKTFKGYAVIQNRQDLLTFLNFVEHSFSTLLNSSGKKLAKKK